MRLLPVCLRKPGQAQEDQCQVLLTVKPHYTDKGWKGNRELKLSVFFIIICFQFKRHLKTTSKA